MAIATLDQYIAAAKQRLNIVKTASRTVVLGMPFSVRDLAGSPTVANLLGSANPSVMVTDADGGFPLIDFSTGVGYLSRVEFGSTVACRMSLFDTIYRAYIAAGYTAATTTMSSQPNIQSRCPDYTGSTFWGRENEIWVEICTAYAGGTSVPITVTYTNSEGTTGRTTGAITLALANQTLGRFHRFPLQAGDIGVQKIESVVISAPTGTYTTGAINVCIMRPLWIAGRCKLVNDGDIHDMLKTGMPVIYATSALQVMIQADSTASGIPELQLEIASA